MKNIFQSIFFGLIVFQGLASVEASVAVSAYEKITRRLEDFSTQFPQDVQRIIIGFNDQNTPIEGAMVGDLQASNPTHHLIVAAHHGNETKSVDLAMSFLEAKIGEKNARIYHIIPVLNISGYNRQFRYETNQAGSFIDPNRDYPDVCNQQKSTFLLQSTKRLAEYVRQYPFVGAITIHGYIGTLTFPWGMYTNMPETKDHQQYLQWLKVASAKNGYRYGTHAEVIYPAEGSFEDWIYADYGIWTILVEMDRYAKISNDVLAMDSFLSQLPSAPSLNNQHLGDCGERVPTTKQRMDSRP